MAKQDQDEVQPVVFMTVVLGALAGIATLTLLITALYHSSIASLDKQHEDYEAKVEKAYNATHVEIYFNDRHRFGDTAVKLVIKGKRYNCMAPATMDLTTGESLKCEPYEVSRDGVLIKT